MKDKPKRTGPLTMKGTLNDFMPHFLAITKDMTEQELLSVVWQLANDEWSRGFWQGNYDPDFESGEYMGEL